MICSLVLNLGLGFSLLYNLSVEKSILLNLRDSRNTYIQDQLFDLNVALRVSEELPSYSLESKAFIQKYLKLKAKIDLSLKSEGF